MKRYGHTDILNCYISCVICHDVEVPQKAAGSANQVSSPAVDGPLMNVIASKLGIMCGGERS